MKSKKMRVITLLLAVVFGLIILDSIVFSAAEADHICSGEDCEICLTIDQCEKLISTVCLAIGAFFAALFIAAIVEAIAILADKYRDSVLTPVLLKVKLLN